MEPAASDIPELTVFAVTLDEAANLPPLVAEVRAVVEGLVSSYEILIVDGPSRDGTAEVAASLGCRVLKQKAPGYGAAVREGLAAARGRYICMIDADLSHPPPTIRDMWPLRERNDVIVASRYVRGGSADQPRARAWLSRVLNFGFGLLFGIPVRDLSSGFRLYRGDCVRGFETRGRDFNVQQELLAGVAVRGWRIAEVPFRYRPRGHGSSHARILKFGVSYARTVSHYIFLTTSLFARGPARHLAPYLIALVLAISATYTGALRDTSVRWDDDYLVFENPVLKSVGLGSLTAMFDPRTSREHYGAEYEPISDLLYAVDARCFGLRDPELFHIQGILWHAVAAVLLFLLGQRLSRSAGVALVAALVFALHPAATEGVIWISGRRTVVAAALVLLAALEWTRYREDGRRLAYACSLAAAALACLTRQLGLATLPVLVAIDVLAIPRPPRRRIAPLVPHALLALCFTALIATVGAREGIVTSGGGPLWHAEAAALGLAYYARLAVLPLWLRPSYGLAGIPFAFLCAGGVIFIVLIGAVVLLRRRARVAAFGLAAALLALAPSLTGLGTQLVAERYLYLSLAFLSLAASAGIARLARTEEPLPATLDEETRLVRRRRLVAAPLVVLLCAMASATYARSGVWHDDVTLWTDAASKDPENRIARRYLGVALLRRGSALDLERAEVELEQAARLEAELPPRNGPSPLPATLDALALVCERRGELDRAERWRLRAVEESSSAEAQMVGLAEFCVRRGQVDRARAVFTACLERNPGSTAARAGLDALSTPAPR